MSGSCLCGAVRYAVSGAFEFLGNCHCSMCRKSHGAAFATWGIISPDQFAWTLGEEFVQRYESSAGTQRCFCRKCGSPLVSLHEGAVGEVVIGTLDSDPGARPREHIFVGSRAPWYELTDELPRFEAWPPGMELPEEHE